MVSTKLKITRRGFLKSSSRLFLVLLVVGMVVSACAGKEEATPVIEEAAPIAAVQAVAPVEAPAAEAPAEVIEVAEFDVVAVVDEYLTALPDGFTYVGKIDAVNEIMDTGEAVVIDVREVVEYEAGHLPGAINIPLRTLTQNLDQVPMGKPVVVYCQSGHRAGMATSALWLLGYENARAFPPSYKGWTEAGEPVSTDMVEAATFETPDIQPELLAAVDDFLTTIPEGFLAIGDLEKFNEAMDNGAFVVDVREPGEYAEEFIPGAINVPIRTLAQNLDQIPTDQPVFVYCKSGLLVALSTTALQVMGYTNVRAFPPSFDGWTAAGEPVAMAQ